MFGIDLNIVWFVLVGVLFTGYFILDGFDLGVGALHEHLVDLSRQSEARPDELLSRHHFAVQCNFARDVVCPVRIRRSAKPIRAFLAGRGPAFS